MSAIDPSKVKAGDTVTATVPWTESFGFQREPYEVTGVTYVGSPDGSLWVGPVELSGRVTITDHQPAPEREWRVGAMYRATVHNDRDVEVMFTRGPATRTDERDAYYPWYVPSQDDFYHEVTDVRPLVVIDPETDADRLSNIIRTVDGNHDLGAGALAEAILRELVRTGGEAS